MLTSEDVQKFIEVFATKDDLKRAVENLSTKEDCDEKWIQQLADKLNVKLEY